MLKSFRCFPVSSINYRSIMRQRLSLSACVGHGVHVLLCKQLSRKIYLRMNVNETLYNIVRHGLKKLLYLRFKSYLGYG